jgi:hypothetical protein
MNSSSSDIFQSILGSADLVTADLASMGASSYSLDSTTKSLKGAGAAQVYFGTVGDDLIDFRGPVAGSGGGKHTIFADAGNNIVLTGKGNDLIFAGAGNDLIEAGDGNNTIAAGDGTNVVITGKGKDIINTGAGNDFIDAGDGKNTVAAGDGNNRILTGKGNDLITAGAGNDVIFSGAGDDVIDAGKGNNLVSAGTGKDMITLGSGKDRVILDGGEGSVTIKGFDAAVDKLRLGESLLGKSLKFVKNGSDTQVKAGSDLLATLKGVSIEANNQFVIDKGPLTRYQATDLGSKALSDATSKTTASVNAASVNDFGVVAGRYNTGETYDITNATTGAITPTGTVRKAFTWKDGVQTDLTSIGLKKGSSDFGAADGATVTLLTPNVNTISNRGEVIGTADEVRQPVGLATDRALVWDKDGKLTINDFGGVESYYLDTNNLNQVAGRNIVSQKDADGKSFNFEKPLFIENGSRTELKTLDGDGGTAASLNAKGTVVGYLDTDTKLNGEEKFTAVVWEQGADGQFTLKNLGTFGDEQARALDINNAGAIIGSSSSPTGAAGSGIVATSSPFIIRDGEYTSIGSLGGNTGSVAEINEFSTVVGASQRADGTNRAYVWSLGVQSDLNNLITSPLTVNGAVVTLTNAVSVNNFGDIVATGTYTYKNSAGKDTVGTRSFLLKEVA